MSRAYEYSTVIERKIEGHLKALGFNMKQPKIYMTIEHKISILNYIRTVKTGMEVLERAVMDTPTDAYRGENDASR